MNQRGVSPVVGMILLVGLTTAVAVGMLTVGLALTDSTSSAAQTQQVQSSMEQLADKGERVSDGDTDTETFTLSGSDSGTASVDADAGRLVITHNKSDGTRPAELYNGSLGSYEYEVEDTTFAYQGGGVWRADEYGEPQMVTPPAFQYRSGKRSGQEATLNFPIMRVSGSSAGNGVVDGELSVQNRQPVYPSDANHTNPLEGGQVYIDIASKYCSGWEAHIDDRTDGNVVESCGQSVNATQEGELRAKLSVPPKLTAGAAAIATKQVSPAGGAMSSIDGDVVVPGGASSVDNETEVNGSIYDRDVDLDPTNVSSKMNICSGSFESSIPSMINGSSPQETDSGTPVYCFEELQHADLTVAPEQDVQIVFENGIDASGPSTALQVTDDNGSHSVEIYTDSEVLYQSRIPMGNPAKPSQTSLYSDDRVILRNSNVHFYGLIYAPVEHPSEDGTVVLHANANVTGSVVSTKIHLQSSESVIQWDDSMEGVDIGEDDNDNPIYYLHVSETELEVSD